MNEFSPLDEQLDASVEALLHNQPMPQSTLNDALGMAIRLKTSQNPAQLHPELDRSTEEAILREFTQQPSFDWGKAFRFAFSGLALAVFALISVNLLSHPAPQVRTLADVQSFESLNATEAILGTLPADAQTSDGLKIADLRASIHSINQLRNSADLELDSSGEVGSFPHIELRDNALEVIEQERELIAQVDIEVDIDTFAGKVADWPTQNEGVDFETHQQAVSGYMKHSEDWNRAIEIWALQQLK